MMVAFVPGPLPGDVRALLERIAAAPDVVHVAAMPDVHLAEDVCVGAVVATRATIYPAAVGGDIGCGMAALGFDAEAAAIDTGVARSILEGLYERIPRDRHARLAADRHIPFGEQLGTLGSGNHFVELQADDSGSLWLMVHSGSRGLGPAIRARHAPPGSGLVGLAADSDAARAYLAEHDRALAWAEENRRRLVHAATDVLLDALGARPRPDSWISCHHNHVRQEHGLWVHRKGAIPAAPGEAGVIPGSMGTHSYHVAGRGHPDALASSSHGAGRLRSRSLARREISVRRFHRELRGVFFDHRRAAALLDEAPSAYKDIDEVMRAQRELTRIVRRLRPVLAFKHS